MPTDILIVGQGIAGTLLGWECERAGISFAIADGGHATAATMAAGGIINPVTGRRLVKSWRYETLFPIAQAAYRGLEAELGVSLWRGMRVRRSFADERERVMGSDPQRRADLAAFIESTDDHGWWVRGAAQVNLGTLLAATRARWLAQGKLRSARVEIEREADRHDIVVDCRGVGGTRAPAFPGVPWEFSKGQLLQLAVEGLVPDVVLNRRWWVMPTGHGMALAGATNEPGVQEASPTEAARALICTGAGEILGPGLPYRVVDQRAGVRVNLPDRRPVIGRSPLDPRLGLVNALGAKGALWAPFLARQWVDHWQTGAAFDSEIDVTRFNRSPRRGVTTFFSRTL